MKFGMLLLAAGIALGAAACNDPNENNTLGPVIGDTLTVYAMTGTSPSFPSGYYTARGAVTRVDGGFSFDVAFDINGDNKVVVYPQALVGIPSDPNLRRLVGIQRLTVGFDDLGRAPASGYVYDSSFVLAPSEGIVIQVQSAVDCLLSFSTVRYTKMIVDSLDAARRTVYFHSVHNPNCGYRSLVPGEVPRN